MADLGERNELQALSSHIEQLTMQVEHEEPFSEYGEPKFSSDN